jgi:hypothetical protein
MNDASITVVCGVLQNADPDVRVDMETFLNQTVPEVRQQLQLNLIPAAVCWCMHYLARSTQTDIQWSAMSAAAS